MMEIAFRARRPTSTNEKMPETLLDPHEHLFNDDLLMHTDDPRSAQERFPRISYILNHPRLKKEFREHEAVANSGRDSVRRFGFAAVGASTLALVALATRSLWPHTEWIRYLAAAIELGGMLAAIILVGGLWFGEAKYRWLRARLMTERIRQWHFQFLLRRGSQIEASYEKGPEAIAQFEKERDRLFSEFLHDFRGKLDNQLEATSNDPLLSFAWLHKHLESYSVNSDAFLEIASAYERLRFEHQYGYAVFKLKTTTDEPFWNFLKWPANMQYTLLSGVSSACFAGAVICAIILILGEMLHLSDEAEQVLRAVAIVVAILGAALRAVQDGLGVEREIDRYREYREAIFILHDRFKRTSSDEERLRLMEELELASVQEMRDFLKIHLRAKFVLA